MILHSRDSADNSRQEPPWPQPITNPAAGIALALLQKRPRKLCELAEAGITPEQLSQVSQDLRQQGLAVLISLGEES
jgi:hypothetical protein